MASDVVARWSARRPLIAATAFLAIVFALIVLALLDRANDTPRWIGAVALVLIAGVATGLVRIAARSEVVLTTRQLRTRSRRGADHSVDLPALTAVAVVRALPGWAIFVWPGDGAPVRLAAPERVFALKSQSLAAADDAYWRRLAGSPAGTAAAQIYRQALTVQGPASVLAGVDVATLIARDRRLFADASARWWSPNGQHGDPGGRL